MGEQKIAKIVAVRWPRWPPRPYMVKTFKNLLLQNRECLGAEPLQESSGTGGLPKLLKELSYVDLFTARSSFLPCAFVWEKPLKTFFSKTEYALWLNLCIYLREQEGHGHTLTFDLFTVRSILLPYAFVWEKCSEFQTTSPLEPLGQFCSNLIWSLLR